MKPFCAVFTAAVLGLGPSPGAGAADLPPAGAMPLSDILAAVPGRIVEAEFDDGRWEVKTCDDARCDKRYVDPHTGRTLRRKDISHKRVPPPGAAPTAAVLVQRLEAADLGVITELEFEHGHWEVKLAVPVTAP